MSIFQELDFDDAELVDPFIFFSELSEELHKPLSKIIIPFLRKYESNRKRNSDVKLFFYNYDEINGFDVISEGYDHRCSYILTKIAQGADVISSFSHIDGDIWKLKDPENQGILDDEDKYTDWRPFYFKLSNLEEFLSYYSITITPYIAVKQRERDNLRINHKQDNTAQEQNISKRENLIKIPVYPSLEAAAKDLGWRQETKSKSEIDNKLSKLKLENEQLMQRIIQLEEVIENAKNNDLQNLNDQPKKESPKTINAQSKFIKALLYIQYGIDVATNPRPHIENVTGEIRKDFETQGLSRELPSYLTVKKWVDSVELDIDS